jgi:hypothetical protein
VPGTVKLGGWYHAGLFNDQRFAANGLSQADPYASAMPAQLRSAFEFYDVLEQQVLKIPGKDERGTHVMTNLVRFSESGHHPAMSSSFLPARRSAGHRPVGAG